MTERAASTTATGVAWMHAAHQLIDSPPRVLDDPVIARLMGATPERMAERMDRLQSPSARALRSHVVTRTRFAEDCLRRAVAHGVRQYVLLGAGMDTFAYRQPPWASDVRVFEVDQPGTQGIKRQRVEAAGVTVPPNLTYVAIDFETEALASGLRRGGVALDQPALFAWLGVTMYLTEEAIDAVLETVLAFPKTSEIVFTFAPARSATEPSDEPTLAERAAAVGEPWLTYFEPRELRAKLASMGYPAIEFLTPAEAAMRYFRDRTDGLPAPRRTTIVSATV